MEMYRTTTMQKKPRRRQLPYQITFTFKDEEDVVVEDNAEEYEEGDCNHVEEEEEPVEMVEEEVEVEENEQQQVYEQTNIVEEGVIEYPPNEQTVEPLQNQYEEQPENVAPFSPSLSSPRRERKHRKTRNNNEELLAAVIESSSSWKRVTQPVDGRHLIVRSEEEYIYLSRLRKAIDDNQAHLAEKICSATLKATGSSKTGRFRKK